MALNERLLRISVAKQGERVLVKKVRPLIELDFDTKKEQFMKEFDENPVTQEIQQGPGAYSQIPSLAEAEGNLFSFLGFEAGKNPTSALREYFERNIRLGRTRAGVIKGQKVEFKTPVAFPTVNEVDAEASRNGQTALEWTSRPFTQLLSRGIPGLPSYLFNIAKRFPTSRSGPAVQAKGALRSGSMPPVPYIGPLLGILKRLYGPKR